MNPSANDWIAKFLAVYEKSTIIDQIENNYLFYNALLNRGFIYGVSMSAVLDENLSSLKLTKEEYTKINLFHALLFSYFQKNKHGSYEEAILSINSYYKQLEKGKSGFLKKLSLYTSPSLQLENIISVRLQETNNALKKSSTSVFTYALLYIDVLGYIVWLSRQKFAKQYSDKFEDVVMTCCFHALKAKKKKAKYDILLIELFESSLDNKAITIEDLHLLKRYGELEKNYILDICTIAVWDDHEMDPSELNFLQDLTKILEFSPEKLQNSLNSLCVFSNEHSTVIKLFEYINPVKLFYKQSTSSVKLLILRNKNRLIKELEESGELLVLLSQSTFRDLNTEEKNKVKEQLLDICKTIPSLTIFLLPGGTILLPLLVKFIPKLLPSAFNENRINKKK